MQSQAIDVIGILVPCGLGISLGMMHRWTGSENTSTYTPEVKHSPWKMMVGRQLSYWDPECFQGLLLLSFQGVQLLAGELLRLSSCKSQEYVGELSATIESHLLLISPRCILCLAYCEWWTVDCLFFFGSKRVHEIYTFAFTFDVNQVFEIFLDTIWMDIWDVQIVIHCNTYHLQRGEGWV